MKNAAKRDFETPDGKADAEERRSIWRCQKVGKLGKKAASEMTA
jgi:hypothetical protein